MKANIVIVFVKIAGTVKGVKNVTDPFATTTGKGTLVTDQRRRKAATRAFARTAMIKSLSSSRARSATVFGVRNAFLAGASAVGATCAASARPTTTRAVQVSE